MASRGLTVPGQEEKTRQHEEAKIKQGRQSEKEVHGGITITPKKVVAQTPTAKSPYSSGEPKYLRRKHEEVLVQLEEENEGEGMAQSPTLASRVPVSKTMLLYREIEYYRENYNAAQDNLDEQEEKAVEMSLLTEQHEKEIQRLIRDDAKVRITVRDGAQRFREFISGLSRNLHEVIMEGGGRISQFASALLTRVKYFLARTKELEMENAELMRELGGLRQVKGTAGKLEEMSELLQKYQSVLAEDSRKLEEARGERRIMEDTLGQVKESVVELEIKCRHATDEHCREMEENREQEESLGRAAEAEAENVVVSLRRVQEMNMETERLRAELDETVTGREGLEKERESALHDLAAHKQHLGECLGKVELLKADKEMLEERHKSGKTNTNTLRWQTQELKEKVAERDREIESLSLSNNSTSDQVWHLQLINVAQAQEIEYLKAAVLQKQNAIDHLYAELQEVH